MQNELEVSCDNLLSRFMVYLSKINMPEVCVFFNSKETRFICPLVIHLIIRFSSFFINLAGLRDSDFCHV